MNQVSRKIRALPLLFIMAKPKPESEQRRPKPLIVPPRKQHTHTIIILHDKGDKGRVFGRDFVKSTALQDHFPTVRFVFPCAFNAPDPQSSQDGTHTNGDVKRRVQTPTQWFHDPSRIRQTAIEGGTASLPETARFLQRLIHDEAKMLVAEGRIGMYAAHKRIVIGGKGHGGAAALLYLLGSHRQLGGFIGFEVTVPWQFQLDLAVAMGMGGPDVGSPARVVHWARALLEFEGVDVKVDRDTHAHRLLHLRTPVFLGVGGPGDQDLGLLFDRAFSVEITQRLWASEGKGWYSLPENLETVCAFLERISIPRSYPVLELTASPFIRSGNAEKQ
ncbi:hypothetical protein BJX64DRAFT_260044 [Aspergillus heterothallicus]